ncbi:MAG: glucosamine-6-phosphate deaminase [Bacillota bacterium]|nr:MAG: glucosamine-6-phosphate deaminase [Bacillota bacterium]MBS3949445.1 glucosamine-6-phosphate deaminase [Peptococcaceae bacterium]
MQIFVTQDYGELSLRAAEVVAAQVRAKPASVLGLATGATPLGMYQELRRANNDVSYAQVTTFNLDEFVGLSAGHPGSYHHYMHLNFVRHVDIDPNNVHLPNGLASDLALECEMYEQSISQAGGIDLQVLGIGRNGHIGFNEPHGKFEAGTHVVKLDEASIDANLRFFASRAEVPQYAITIGIRTIMLAQRILLLASGADKAHIIAQAVRGPITPSVPASVLQLHRNVVVIVDRAANQQLTNSEGVQQCFTAYEL